MAGLCQHFLQRFSGALAGDLQNAQPGKAVNHGLDPIVAERLLHGFLHLPALVLPIHIDKVDQNHPGKAAKPNLPGNLPHRRQILGKGQALAAAAFHKGAAVHIHGAQGLPLVDHQVAAVGKGHLPAKGFLQLSANLQAIPAFFHFFRGNLLHRHALRQAFGKRPVGQHRALMPGGIIPAEGFQGRNGLLQKLRRFAAGYARRQPVPLGFHFFHFRPDLAFPGE